MARDVKVKLNLAKPATGVGFGYPLIFEGKAEAGKAIAYTECSTIDDVIRVIGGITSSDTAQQIATKTAAAMATNMYKAAALLFNQDNAPAKIAICATTTAASTGLATIVHLGWRQLIVTSIGTTGEDKRNVISDYIETTADKMYFTSVANTTGGTVKQNDRTMVLVHNETGVSFPEAALVGATAGKPAGSFTYKNIKLKGLTPQVMSDSEITAVHNAHAICFVLKAGSGVTSEGKVASGEYADIIDSQDYVIQNIEYQTQQLLNNTDKIPYDNNGIAMLENVCVNVLQTAANNGIIAMSDEGVPDFSVSYKPRSETKATDRAARKYVEGSFRFALAGAIHEVEINGTIEI